MNVYREAEKKLAQNQPVILLSEWERGDGGAAENLRQKLQIWDPQVPTSPMEESLAECGRPVVETEGARMRLAEPFYPEERLILLGGGHVALALAKFASQCGFAVTVADDRISFANPGRFPWAKRVICDRFDQALKEIRIRANDYVCVLTRGHRFDLECLRVIGSGTEPGYLGMIGSRRRVAIVKETLVGEGYDAERLARLHSPIGLAIGAVTPEEIAVSILAELIEVKRKGRGPGSLRSRSDLDYDVLRELAGGTDGSAAVATVIVTKGSAPRGAGAKMLIYPDGRLLGSIGGGCSEAEVIAAARRMIGTGRCRVVHVDLTGDASGDDGMVCGGVMDVLIQA